MAGTVKAKQYLLKRNILPEFITLLSDLTKSVRIPQQTNRGPLFVVEDLCAGRIVTGQYLKHPGKITLPYKRVENSPARNQKGSSGKAYRYKWQKADWFRTK